MTQPGMMTELTALLPAAEVLPEGTPRYPNLWLHMLGVAGEEANDRARNVLERATGMIDDLPEQQNPEGADEWGRRRELEPVQLDAGDRSHDHQLHMRIYNAGLGKAQQVEVSGEAIWRIGVSVHYEVDRPRELHPYVDECPRCGCVDEFEDWRDADLHAKNVSVHDPLGLELTVSGKVRDRPIAEIAGLLATEGVADHVVLHRSHLSRRGIEAASVALVAINSG